MQLKRGYKRFVSALTMLFGEMVNPTPAAIVHAMRTDYPEFLVAISHKAIVTTIMAAQDWLLSVAIRWKAFVEKTESQKEFFGLPQLVQRGFSERSVRNLTVDYRKT